MHTPMISIVIPVYNGEKYLKEAIDSALAQTYKNFEVIVVNDGSDDNGATEKIALSYGKQIKYFYKPNGGVATALNFGIRKMQGDYFSWLSHDDLYYPDKLECQIKKLQEIGNRSALIYCDYDIEEIETGALYSTNFNKSYSMAQLTNSVFSILQTLIHGCTPLIHKSHFERIGLFDEKLKTSQDYDMLYRMFRGQRIVFLAEPLIRVRVHKNMGTNTISCFNQELGNIYIKSMNSLSEKEVKDIFIHPAILYSKIAGLLKSYNLMIPYQVAVQKLMSTTLPANILENLELFKKYIACFSNGNAKKICIFGAGYYGKRLHYDLYNRMITVDFFSDNDPKKWGSSVEGISCLSVQQLFEIKDDTLIIIAARIPTKIIKQLKTEQYLYIVTKQELDGKVAQTIPLNNIVI